jgi:AraC-like DNA-binding protein
MPQVPARTPAVPQHTAATYWRHPEPPETEARRARVRMSGAHRARRRQENARVHVKHQLFADADHHASALQGWDQRYDQLSAGRFQSALRQLQVEGVQVFHEAANRQIVQQGVLPADTLIFGIPLSGVSEWTFRNLQVQRDSIIACSGGQEFVLHSPPQMEMVGIVLGASFIELLNEALGSNITAITRGKPVLDVPHAAYERAALQLVRLLCEIDASSLEPAAAQNASLDHAGATPAFHASDRPSSRALAHQVVDLLAQTLVFAMPDASTPLTHACQSDIVRRSHELVLAHPEEPLSVLDLCAKLKVSRRTVQNSFQAISRMTPVDYLRSIRLNAARRVLHSTRARDVSIREAARRWGFLHLGHFAREYQLQFGELPSQTARRT